MLARSFAMDMPPAWQICCRNLAIVLPLYSLLHALLYVWKVWNAPSYKFNKKYPPSTLVWKEVYRAIRSTLIAGLFEFLLSEMHKSGWVPLLSATPEITWSDAYVFPVLFVWGDFHFYSQHRLFHEITWLYQNIHKIHHESFNPTPWSGLSFHPLETVVYMSSVLIVLIIPMKLWMLKAMFLALLISPSIDHTGHGIEGSPLAWRHYIHHSKFNYNYSGTKVWDVLFGTEYALPCDRNDVSKGKAA